MKENENMLDYLTANRCLAYAASDVLAIFTPTTISTTTTATATTTTIINTHLMRPSAHSETRENLSYLGKTF